MSGGEGRRGGHRDVAVLGSLLAVGTVTPCQELHPDVHQQACGGDAGNPGEGCPPFAPATYDGQASGHGHPQDRLVRGARQVPKSVIEVGGGGGGNGRVQGPIHPGQLPAHFAHSIDHTAHCQVPDSAMGSLPSWIAPLNAA